MNIYVVHHSDANFKKFEERHQYPESYFVLTHEKKYSKEEFEEILQKVVDRIVYTGELFKTVQEKLIEKHGFKKVESIGTDITYVMTQKTKKKV
jgi:hypothetical protein